MCKYCEKKQEGCFSSNNQFYTKEGTTFGNNCIVRYCNKYRILLPRTYEMTAPIEYCPKCGRELKEEKDNEEV